MGSGSSKEEKKSEPVRDVKKEKSVANVNKGTPANKSETVQKQPVQNTFITQPEDSIEPGNDRNGTHIPNFNDDNSHSTKQTRGHSVWRADQETQDELNEVLQIPTDNKQTSRPVHSVNPVRQTDLPETYAQRKQREQYTLNQQMLLRQKTIYRNPDEWQWKEEEEETHGGFDPSKFRSVNKGTTGRSAVFTTGTKEGPVQYMPGQQNMDEFDVSPRQQNVPKDLPVYNASEQDLMASLERELM